MTFAAALVDRRYNPAAAPIRVPFGALDSMLSPGSQLGAYEIIAHVGAGGMGEHGLQIKPKVGRPVPLFMPFWSLIPHQSSIRNYGVSSSYGTPQLATRRVRRLEFLVEISGAAAR